MSLISKRSALLSAAGLAVAAALTGQGMAAPAARAASASHIVNVSGACSDQNAEVEDATAPPDYVYQLWIGCKGIGFARSTDGGRTYGTAAEMPGSANGWDPSIAAGPHGVVYAAYMVETKQNMYPVVAISYDHGATFSRVTALKPSQTGNWGDRDFIAAAPDGTVYVTWDYGPKASLVTTVCAANGSCAFKTGDNNAVVQKSTDGGRTFGPITPIGPGFPRNGGYGAPVVVDRLGHVDALYWGHRIDPGTYLIHPGYEFFTSSRNGDVWHASPAPLYPNLGSIAIPTWWIDGDLTIDAAGILYATWDTQTAAGDIGYLTYSVDGGATWSRPVRVTPDTDDAVHIVQVAGGAPGTAYVGWQTDAPSQGYATYVQRFSVIRGLIGTPTQVSTAYGNPAVWPGDTFGMSTIAGGRLALSWGSADGTSKTSEIYATTIPAP